MNAKYKIGLVGDESVGKSSLVNFVAGRPFYAVYVATDGLDLNFHKFYENEKEYRYNFVELGGMRRNEHLLKDGFTDLHALIVVYSIMDRESFENAQKWIKNVKDIGQRDDLIINLVANKVDLEKRLEVVTPEEGRAFAEANNLFFFETSVVAATGIKELFNETRKRLNAQNGRNWD